MLLRICLIWWNAFFGYDEQILLALILRLKAMITTVTLSLVPWEASIEACILEPSSLYSVCWSTDLVRHGLYIEHTVSDQRHDFCCRA